jgi:hypothetical protein
MKKIFSLIAAVLFAGSMFAADVTITPANCGWSSEAGEQSGVVDGVTIAVTKGLASTGQNPDQIRIYKGETLTISSEANITKVVFTCTANGTTKYGPGCFAEHEGYTFEAEGKTGTWEGSAKSLTFVAESNQVRATEIVVTTDGDAPQVDKYYVVGSMTGWGVNEAYKLVANPENEGEFMGEFTFAANDEFKVVKNQSEVWYPDGMDNNYKINEDGDYAVYFRPEGGVADWYYGFFNVIKKETPVALSLAEFIASKPTEEVTLKDLTVIFANGKNTYVIDAEGIALVIYDANKTYYDGTLTAGTVLSGQKATYQLYKNQDEIIPTNTAEISAGVAPVPTELDAKPTDANINHFVSFKNVAAVKAEDNKFYIFGDVQLYGATGSLKPTEDGNYDIEGLYILYNGTTPEIIVTALQASGEQGIEEILSEGKTVKVVREGKLVILKGDHEFTPMGQIVK